MGNFDIVYSKRLPPAQGPNVTISPNVSTGAELVAQAIQGLGGVFSRMNEAWEATQLSTMKRRYDEAGFEALRTYSETGDEDARKVLLQKWSQDIDGIRSESNSVNRQFREYRNDVEPKWADNFAGAEALIQKRNILADGRANIQKYLEQGDILKVDEQAKILVDKNLISPAEGQELMRDAPNDAILAQANRMLTTNPNGALKILDNLKNPTERQAEKQRILAGVLNRQVEQLSAQFEDSICQRQNAVDMNPKTTEVDVVTTAETLKNEIYANTLITEKDKMRMVKQVNNWMRGEGETDYPKLLALNEEIDIAYRTNIVDKTLKDRINRAYLEGAFGPRAKGGEKTYGDMMRRFNNIKLDSRIRAVGGIVEQFKRENADEPDLIFLFDQAKNKWFDEHSEADERESYQQISTLKTVYEQMSMAEVRRRIKGEKDEFTQPKNKEEFEAKVRIVNKLSPAQAREYYEKYKHLFYTE